MTLRSIFYVSLCALLAACTDAGEPVDAGEPIEFGRPAVELGAATAGRAQLLEELPEGEVFGVSAYCVPLDAEGKPDYPAGSLLWADKKARSVADVMSSQPIKWDGAKCVYRDAADNYYEPARWYTRTRTGDTSPLDFTYTFLAWHPLDGGYFTPVDPDAAGAPRLVFTMPHAGSGDIGTELDSSPVRDAMVAMTVNHTRSLGSVPLTFRHLLCGIRFQINNFNTSSALTVHSLSMSGRFFRTALIDFAPDLPVLTVNPVDTYAGRFTFIGDDTATEPNSATVTPLTVLLLPNLDGSDEQAYLGADKTVTVSYTFQGVTESRTISPFTIGRKPVAGTVYTVNLNFVGRQLTVSFTDPSNETWEGTPGYSGDNVIN